MNQFSLEESLKWASIAAEEIAEEAEEKGNNLLMKGRSKAAANRFAYAAQYRDHVRNFQQLMKQNGHLSLADHDS